MVGVTVDTPQAQPPDGARPTFVASNLNDQSLPDPAAGRSKRRRRLWWLAAGVWAVLLLMLAVWSSAHDPTTVREQTTLSSARKTIEQSVAKVRAAAPATWAEDDGGYADSTCPLTLSREGRKTVRILTFSGAGDESDLLKKAADSLGGAVVHPADGGADGFYKDVGNYVAVRGQMIGSGTVVVEFSSGCRGSS